MLAQTNLIIVNLLSIDIHRLNFQSRFRLFRCEQHEGELGTERSEASVLRPAEEILADHHHRRRHNHHRAVDATHWTLLLLLPMRWSLWWAIPAVRQEARHVPSIPFRILPAACCVIDDVSSFKVFNHFFSIKLHQFRFGVIVAYVTNITLQHGVENATISARYAVEDTRTYLKSTSYHIRHLLVNNYGELKEHLFHTLDKTSDTVVTQLDAASNAVSLDQLHNIVEALPEIQQDLIDMDKITRDMQQKASQLNDGTNVHSLKFHVANC